ncbi:MAG: tetrahydrofolate synthase [Flavobacteriales bacterium]|nr:tetrahydrofolate synthase [Flavobacteriales bacterium]
MSYEEITNWMFKRLSSYQIIGKDAYNKSLNNINNFSNYNGNPEQKIKIIHIAGTNGKGSTSNILHSILQENNLKVGLFTSPHLFDFRERIRINRRLVPKNYVINFIKKNKSYLLNYNLSFFEMTTAMAFDYFYKNKVDIAIIEAGLGGRLDATNIIKPEISVITNISFDHENILGNTIQEIAEEKSGIIKKNVPLVLGDVSKKAESVIIKKAIENSSNIIKIKKEYSLLNNLNLKLVKENYYIALEVIGYLNQKKYNIIYDNIINGIKNFDLNTNFRGRYEVKSNNPKVIFDIAHNLNSFEKLFEKFDFESFENFFLIIGFSDDKNINKILSKIPTHAHCLFCQSKNSRSLKVSKLKTILKKYFFTFKLIKDCKKAYQKALNISNKNDLIIVCGSTFVVAEILQQ